MFEADSLRQALSTLGVLLKDRAVTYEIVALAGDQICFKLYAAADNGPGSKHVHDLVELDPTPEQFRDAAAWVTEQDTAAEFPSLVDAVIAHVEATRAKR